MLPLTLLGKYKYFLMTRKKMSAIINKKNLIKSKSTKSILKQQQLNNNSLAKKKKNIYIYIYIKYKNLSWLFFFCTIFTTQLLSQIYS